MKRIWGLFVALSFSLYSAGDVLAVGSGGYENQVPGARAMGRANSVVASIDDASAIFFNPARLTSIDRSQLSLGFTAQNIGTEYNDGAGTTIKSDNDMSFTPNFYWASKFASEKWAFGLGVNIPHGVATNWKKDTPMAFVATETDLSVLDINPAVAYKVNDKFSVGVGINYYSVDAKSDRYQDVDVGGGFDGVPDLDNNLEGDGDDFGANVGFSFAPNEKHLFGLSYRTGANVDIEGDLNVRALSADGMTALMGADSYYTSAESKVVVPASLQMGYAQKVNDKFTAEIDVQWNRWSRFNAQDVKFGDTTSQAFNKDWDDVWSVGLGGEYWLRDNVALRGGYAFFDSPIPNETFEASTPDSDMHVLTFGVGFGANSLIVDLAAQFYLLNDRHIDNAATLPGTYETHAEYFGLNVGYKFGN